MLVQPAAAAGGVAADGAVGQRGVPSLSRPPPPPKLAELPLTVQLVSVAVPPVVVQAAAVVAAELPLRCSWSAWPCRRR